MAIDNLPRASVEATTDAPPVPAQTPYIHADYTPAKARPARTGSAAMVVAKATGRGLGGGARWFVTGVRKSGRKWVAAYHDDYPRMIAVAKAELRAAEETGDITEPKAKVEAWREEHRERRLQHLRKTGIGTLATTGTLATGGLVVGGWLDLLLAGVGMGAAAWHGHRSQVELTPAQQAPMLAAGEVDDGEPFPLAWCKDGEQVRTCLERALKAEGIGTRAINILGYRGWGWELAVELKGATPGKVLAASDQIEGHLALPDGGFMPEPDSRDKSKVTVRLVASNPFADMGRPTVHTPKSLSVHDTVVMGRAMDGGTLELSLDGFCALIIGAMGAGKSLGVLRTINEALTACRDAVVWDLDPIKGGLSEFGGLMARRARGPEECEAALEEVLSYVTARGALMGPLGMGDRWYATAEHPNLYVNIDEFIQLSPKGKELAIKILRTGRQYGIYLIMAGQEATADALGDAIAAIVAYRILMACRFEDVKIAFGVGAGALGWRPDRMKPAVGPVANDAGQAMIMGGALTRAIRHQFNAYTREQITAAVPERVKAGVPQMDTDTLLKAGVRGGQAAGLADRLDALAAQAGIGDARLVAVLMREFELSGETFLPTATLLPALQNTGWEGDSDALSRMLRKHAPGVTTTRDNTAEGKPRGWTRDAVEQAAAGLLDPVRARSQAG
jgi:S-DNA-T family DNA segregation ATPase FtsK/SpoIIIE